MSGVNLRLLWLWLDTHYLTPKVSLGIIQKIAHLTFVEMLNILNWALKVQGYSTSTQIPEYSGHIVQIECQLYG